MPLDAELTALADESELPVVIRDAMIFRGVIKYRSLGLSTGGGTAIDRAERIFGIIRGHQERRHSGAGHEGHATTEIEPSVTVLRGGPGRPRHDRDTAGSMLRRAPLASLRGGPRGPRHDRDRAFRRRTQGRARRASPRPRYGRIDAPPRPAGVTQGRARRATPRPRSSLPIPPSGAGQEDHATTEIQPVIEIRNHAHRLPQL